MKHLLLAFFCFLFAATVSAQVVDTVVYEGWSNDDWQLSFRTINTYNADCQVETTTFQLWDGNSQEWSNLSLSTYTYTGVTHVSQVLGQTWNPATSTWDSSSRETHTYDPDYREISVLQETWFGTEWTNSSRTTNTYDASGYLISTLDETWNVVSGDWENSTLDSYSNNGDGAVIQSISQKWNTTTSVWDNDTRDTYTYNDDKTIGQIVSETWNTTTSAWENSERTTLTYNAAGKPLTGLLEMWDTDWVNETLITYTYDANNYVTNLLSQNWSVDSAAWVNEAQFIYMNNSDGTVHQVVLQGWDTDSSAWVNASRTTYSYTNTCLLPLTLLDFSATRKDNIVLLDWKTTNEVNTSHFTIQRSTNAIDFNNLGNVPTKGNGSVATNNYGYSDNITGIQAPKLYYRLLMADKDGKTTTSKIVSVALADRTIQFTVKPNPARNYFILTPQVSGSFVNAVMHVTNISGRVVLKQNIVSGAEQKIDVSTLPKGMYIVSITTAGSTKTQKLVVE